MSVELLFDGYETSGDGQGQRRRRRSTIAREARVGSRPELEEGGQRRPHHCVVDLGRAACRVPVRDRVAVDEVHDVLERREAAARDLHRQAQGSRRGRRLAKAASSADGAPRQHRTSTSSIGGDRGPDDSDFMSYVVERDMYQPDMAAIVLSNQDDIYIDKIKVGDAGRDQGRRRARRRSTRARSSASSRLQGRREDTTISIRAMNKMHRLLRMRKSLTFTDKTDSRSSRRSCSDAGLTLEWKHEKSITYKHVYQHNQTDLEFLRMRAARIGLSRVVRRHEAVRQGAGPRRRARRQAQRRRARASQLRIVHAAHRRRRRSSRRSPSRAGTRRPRS